MGLDDTRPDFRRTTIRTCRSGRRQRMTRIAITVEAYEVIAAPPFDIGPACPTGGRPESISPGSAQHAARGKGPYVFPGGRPRQPLSVMAMTMAMPRLGAGDFTVHGIRSAARSWMSAPRTRIIRTSRLRGGTPAVRPPLLRSPASKPHGSLMMQLRRAVGADPSLKRQAKPDRRSASRRARVIPFVLKKTVEQQGHPGPPSGSATGRSRGDPLCPEQSGDPRVDWLARLHVCPQPERAEFMPRASWARGLFCL